MRTSSRFTRSLAEIDQARHEAEDNETAQLADQSWTQTLVADRHAMLVGRFMMLSAAERQLAARMAATPGGSLYAEAARVRATRYYDIAERHRRASEDYERGGLQLASEVRSKQRRNGGQQQQQRPQQPAQPAAAAARQPQRPGPAQQATPSPNGNGVAPGPTSPTGRSPAAPPPERTGQ